MKIETHPTPYKLAWLNKGGEVLVSQRALISFSIGTKYKDKVWCDVVTMDACHLLLGRPWLYDRRVIHDGCANTYSFNFNNTKVVLLPSRDIGKSKRNGDNISLLSLARYTTEVSEGTTVPKEIALVMYGHSIVKCVQLQRFEHGKETMLHSYHVKHLQIRERISSTQGGMCRVKIMFWS